LAGPFDKLGTGDLLPDARENFEQCVVGKGWELILLPGPIVDIQVLHSQS